MATKTATKKKATTKSAASKTPKTTTAKKASKATSLPVGIISEKNPDAHVATGKYKFFFTFFGITTVLFAAVSVWLFVFSSQVLDKWESIDTCVRNDTCKVVQKDSKVVDAEDDVDDSETTDDDTTNETTVEE